MCRQAGQNYLEGRTEIENRKAMDDFLKENNPL